MQQRLLGERQHAVARRARQRPEEIRRLRGSLLEQMQADDFSDTGGDVYARGHLRVIAGVLDIDAACLLAAYDEASTLRRPPAP